MSGSDPAGRSAARRAVFAAVIAAAVLLAAWLAGALGGGTRDGEPLAADDERSESGQERRGTLWGRLGQVKADAGPSVITGRVLDAEGNGAQAEVTVFSERALAALAEPHARERGKRHEALAVCKCAGALQVLADWAEPGGGGDDGIFPAPEASALSDAATGAFVLEVPGGGPFAIFARGTDGGGSAELRMYLPRSKADGAEGGEGTPEGTYDGENGAPELWLSAAFAVRGRVVDESGAPIPGASVALIPQASPFAERTSADGSGRFAFERFAPAGRYRLVAAAMDYMPASEEIFLPPSPADRERVVRLSSPHAIQGTVLFGDGRPAPGALVRLWKKTASAEKGETARCEAGSGGAFWFGDLAPGEYRLSASSGSASAVAGVTLSGGSAQSGSDASDAAGSGRVTLVLTEGLQAEGTVRDGESGQGIMGAAVRASFLGQTVVETLSDASGEFALAGVPEGSLLTASAEGYLTDSVRPDSTEGRIDVALMPAVTVEGRLIPSASARRDIPAGLPILLTQGETLKTAFLDAEGGFRFELARKGRAVLEFHHSEFGTASAVVDAPARDVVLKLHRGAAVTARVVSSDDGAPVAGAMLGAARGTPQERETGDDALLTDVPADAEGRLTLAGLKPSAYDLRFSAQGFADRVIRDVVIFDADETRDLGTIRLDKGLSILGRVISGSDQRGVEGAVVTVVHGGRMSSVTSGAEGSFEVGGLDPANGDVVFLAAESERGMSRGETFSPGTRGASLVLVPEERHKVRGRVVSPSGTPVLNFSVEGKPFSTADGTFETDIPALESEPAVRIVVASPGFAKTSLDVELSESGISDLGTIRLHRGVTIEGTVTDRHGTPLEGIRVQASALGADMSHIPPSVSAPSGGFSLQGIDPDARVVVLSGFRKDPGRPEGKVRVSLRGHGVGSGSEESVIRGVELVMDDATGILEGNVTDESGRPVQGAAVSLLGDDRRFHTVTGSDGTYRLEGFPIHNGNAVGAACRLEGEGGRFISEVRPVVLDSSGRGRIDFELSRSGTGTLTVTTDIPDARYAVLVPAVLTEGKLDGESGAAPEGLSFGNAAFRDGRAEFRGIRPGRYIAVVRTDASSPAAAMAPVTLSSGIGSEVRVTADMEISGPGADMLSIIDF